MRVVSDTSPLCHAIWIDEAEVFPALFGGIVIGGVAEELASEGAPRVVRSWIDQPPEWLDIQPVEIEDAPPALARLHRGEREALYLAHRSNADLLLVDERPARRIAETLG